MDDNIYDLAIVGAGVSGLTTAIELSEKSNNAMKILMLEAGDNVGGRVKTVKMADGMPIELGAQWFHGGDNNSFYQWVRERFPKLGGFVLDTAQNRKIIWDQKHPDKTFKEALDLLDARYDAFKASHPDKDISLYTLAHETKSPMILEAAQFMSKEWMATDGAHMISCNAYFEDPNGSGGWQLKNGLSQVTNLMANLARQRGVTIRIGQRVQGVNTITDDFNELRLESGEIVKAREILVTASAGVLKKKSIKFEPHLQRDLDEHVSGLVMANLSKIIMPLTPEFNTVGRADARYYMIREGYYLQGRGAGKPVMTLFAGGYTAQCFETANEATLMIEANKTFGKIPGLGKLQNTLEFGMRTQWGIDQDFLGSYSNLKPHETRYGHFELKDSGVWIAGEAFTKEGSAGSMSGAHDSGVKVANDLLQRFSHERKRGSTPSGPRPYHS